MVDGQSGEDLTALRHERDAEGHPLGGGEIGDVPPGEDDRTVVGAQEPGQGRHRRRLARAVQAQEHQPLSLEHLEGEIPQHRGRPVVPGPVADLEVVGHDQRFPVGGGFGAEQPRRLLRAEVGADHLRMAPHLLRLPGRQGLAEIQAVHVVAHRRHERHVVLDHQDGELEGPAQLQERVAEGGGLPRAHPRRRLVEQDEVGIGGQHGGQFDVLEHAVGQPVHLPVQQTREAEDLGQGLGPPGEPPLVGPGAREAQDAGGRGVAGGEMLGGEKVGPDRGAPDQADVLEGPGHPGRRPLVGREVGDVDAPEPHPAVVGPAEPADDVEQRRLAGAVGPDDPDDLQFADHEGDVAQRPDAAEPDRAAVDLKHGPEPWWWPASRRAVPPAASGRSDGAPLRTRRDGGSV